MVTDSFNACFCVGLFVLCLGPLLFERFFNWPFELRASFSHFLPLWRTVIASVVSTLRYACRITFGRAFSIPSANELVQTMLFLFGLFACQSRAHEAALKIEKMLTTRRFHLQMNQGITFATIVLLIASTRARLRYVAYT